VTVFLQGMRRNGTTIFFDLLAEDGQFKTWYEPLAKATAPSFGGGSAVRDVDYFENVRSLRQELVTREVGRGYDDFNYGAPRNPELEIAQDTPDYIRSYLTSMIEGKPRAVVKFTRMARKMGTLHAVDPSARVVVITRDPRRVVASHIFGKNGKNKDRFGREEVFFSRARNRIGWSIPTFSDVLLAEAKNAQLQNLRDFERVLLVWRESYQSSWTGAQTYFGEAAMRVRHEDLCNEPESTLKRLYEHLGAQLPTRVVDWARHRVRPPSRVFASRSECWNDAFNRLGMNEMCDELGYGL